jgi:glycosyltransferase involved in cell wall biosynthesis
MLGIPFALTFHALGVVKRRHQGAKDTSPACRLEHERSLSASADLLVATCTDEVFELARMNTDLGNIRVVPCGVDLDLFSPLGPAEARRSERHRVVVVTRLVERKGVGNVIEALADVPSTELVVAGGPDRADLSSDLEVRRLRALARAKGVEDRVELRGALARTEVAPLLRSADVVACVPWYEPFGIVPLEAMACGIPVLASAVGGLIDTVVDGVTGVHVPARSPERIAEALRSLVTDAEWRRALGEAGAERARTRYSWPTIAGATLRAYSTVVATPERATSVAT